MKGESMPKKKYEVFVDGYLSNTTEDKERAETMARFLLEEYSNSKISIREWILKADEVLQ